MVSLFGPKADPASSKKDGKFKKSNTKTTKKDTQKKMTKATTATKNIKNTTVGGKGGKGNQGGNKGTKGGKGGKTAAARANEHANIPAWRYTLGDLAAGATAGATVEAALYPIDTIKTRLQLMTSGGGIRALLRAGGGTALYAGVWGNLVGVMPASALFMAVYEPARLALPPLLPASLSFFAPFSAGAAAGLASSLIRVPTEVVKQRMQTGEFKHAAKAVRHIATKEGVRGLYAGYSSFLLRDLPFDAIQFCAYEQAKVAYQKLVGGRELNTAEIGTIGAIAGAFTGFITTPLDVLKTRLMTQGASGQYKGVVDCAVKIAKTEGGKAFFRGWEPRVTWIGIGGSIFFGALEASKKFYAPQPVTGPLN